MKGTRILRYVGNRPEPEQRVESGEELLEMPMISMTEIGIWPEDVSLDEILNLYKEHMLEDMIDVFSIPPMRLGYKDADK